MKPTNGELTSNRIFIERAETEVSKLKQRSEIYPNNYGIKKDLEVAEKELDRLLKIRESLNQRLNDTTTGK